MQQVKKWQVIHFLSFYQKCRLCDLLANTLLLMAVIISLNTAITAKKMTNVHCIEHFRISMPRGPFDWIIGFNQETAKVRRSFLLIRAELLYSCCFGSAAQPSVSLLIISHQSQPPPVQHFATRGQTGGLVKSPPWGHQSWGGLVHNSVIS